MKFINLRTEEKTDLEEGSILVYRSSDYAMDYQRYDNIFQIIGKPVPESYPPLKITYT